ncbi:MAG: DUF4124 domain-containing protein [Pseudomonadota bacterium]
MRLFYLLLTIALIAALAAPFVLKAPNGQPLMRVEDVLDDSTAGRVSAAPTTVYRWQDASGIWQYGSAPPAGTAAQPVQIDTSATLRLGAEWDVTDLVAPAADTTPAGGAFALPDNPLDLYRSAPELLEASRDAGAAMQARNEELQRVMGELHKQ